MTKKKQIEFRSVGKTEARKDDDGQMILEGRAITFNVRSQVIGDFVEIINPTKINYRDVVTAKIDHDGEKMVGKTGKNLTLEERSDGLYYRLELPDTTVGRDMFEMHSRGLADSNSFEFYSDAEVWTRDSETGLDLRTVTEFTLSAINPLMNSLDPAYVESFIEPRSLTILKQERSSTQDKSKDKDINKQTKQKKNFRSMKKKELLEKRTALYAEMKAEDITLDVMKEKQEEVRQVDEKIELIELRAKAAFDEKAKEERKKDPKKKDEVKKLDFRTIPSEGIKINMSSPEVRAVVSDDVKDGRGRVVNSLIEALAPENIMQKVGAKISYNNYDTVIPISGGLTGTVEFVGENVAAPKMGYTLTKKTLTPKRVPISVEISKSAVMSDEVGIEGDILKLAVEKLYETIEKKFFSADVATEDAPAGLLALATTKDVLAAGVSDDLLAENEYALADQGVRDISVVSTGLIQRDLRATPIGGSGSGVMLYNPNDTSVRGLKFQRSAYLEGAANTKDVMLFGDFSQVLINFFGNTNITVDPYTKAGENMMVYTFDFNVDWGIAHPAALLFLSNIKA